MTKKNEIMTPKEFVEAYERAPQKDAFWQRNIKDVYVSYFQKIAEAHTIVNYSMYKEVNGRKVFWKDSPSLFQLFMCRLIAHYTSIDLGDNSAEGFDELNRAGLINEIVTHIPEKEYKEWSTILEMVANDEMENSRSFAGYLDTKLEAISILMNTLIENDDIKNAISDRIVQFANQEG